MADGNIKQIKLPNNKIYNLHDARVDNLPNPMVFKGTLGSGGTISSLPAASTTNEGWTYKVITDGTYAGETAKIGDAFISNGAKWELIPSGDEPSGTVTNVATGTGLIGGPITTSGTISHATGAGYNHIPSGGSSGQILRWSADGTATWSAESDTKNTTGATDTNSAFYLVGPLKSAGQVASGQTYSDAEIYAQDGVVHMAGSTYSDNGYNISILIDSNGNLCFGF